MRRKGTGLFYQDLIISAVLTVSLGTLGVAHRKPIHRIITLKPESPKSSLPSFSISGPNLSVEQKALVFMIMLGIFGAVLGGISTEIDIRSCTQNLDCSLINLSQRRSQGIQNGGLAGMIAALISSAPALMKDLQK